MLNRIVPFALLLSLSAGCAATSEEDAVETSGSAYSSGADGLAQWLRTNHTVKYMGQFLDWRPAARTPFALGALSPDQNGGLVFPQAVFESPEVEAMMKVAREADRLALPIEVGAPAQVELPDLVCAATPGVHVYGQHAQWLSDRAAHVDLGAEDAALVDGAVAGATTEVLIALPGDDTRAPMVRLAFGIVQRPLSAAPGAPVNNYWTILAASIAEPRCAPRTRPVFSLSSQHDNLLTINAEEKQNLVASGDWYVQGHPTRAGFELGVGDGPGRVGIYRCYYPGYNLHFMSVSATCEGGTQEGLLGYASAAYAGDAKRTLRRCLQTYNQFTHVLDAPCAPGARDDGVLGWVR